MTETYAGQGDDNKALEYKVPKNRRLTAAAYTLLSEMAVMNPDGAEAKFLSTAIRDGWIVEEPAPRGTSISDMRPQLIEGYDRPDQNES